MYETQDHSGHRPPFATNGPQRFGKPVEPGRILRAILRAKWWVIATACLGLAVGIGLAQFVIKREYVARAQLLWVPSSSTAEWSQLQTLQGQVEIEPNLREIRERLALNMRLAALGSKIDVLVTEGDRNVTITARSDTKEGAASLANTTVDVFLSRQAQQARMRAEEKLNRLREDFRAAQSERDDARRRYDDFRRERGIVDIETETQRAIEEAADLTAQATLSQERRTGGRNGRPGAAIDGALAERIRAKRAELAEAQSTYTDEHPRVQQLKFQLRTLEEQARAAAAAAEAATPTPTSRPRSQDAGPPVNIGAINTEIQQRLARLSQAEGDASKLLAEVRVAEAHVTELDAEVARAQDEARSARAEFTITAEAYAPEDADKSYKRPVAIITPILFLLIALAVLVIRELWGMYVYTANEAAFWGRGPVVGSSTWPAGPHTLKSLTQELGDLIPKAIGMTLVVPTSREDELLAEAVAGRLQLFSNEMTAPDPDASLDEAETRIFVDVRTDNRAGDPIDAVIVDPSTGAPIMTPPPGSSGTGKHAALAVISPNMSPGSSGLPVAYQNAPPAVIGQQAAPPPNALKFTAWKGALEGPHLRGAARQVDRVLVVVASGKVSVTELGEIRTQLGRDDGVAFLVVGLPPDLSKLPDRAGPVEAFWYSHR